MFQLWYKTHSQMFKVYNRNLPYVNHCAIGPRSFTMLYLITFGLRNQGWDLDPLNTLIHRIMGSRLYTIVSQVKLHALKYYMPYS